ncbi:hypothetical protein [Achromobacter deleyi]|uniref:hypothetical protein n=1 Tax=Achromobacter deleyi TaxID=1353891 RepID=UPI0014919A64|nr:hypothetical protein [Achromobacter deleyi]QVQ27981.1 hypothetical protein HLG70_05950 [Achromobacter deleyi]UIP23594.1 hypothetical protein LYZ39_14070 [Achromobacter deleyi]
MAIRSSVLASLFVCMLAPMAVSANGGTIHFTGEIVEPAGCRARVAMQVPAVQPQVICRASASGSTQSPNRPVRAYMRALAPQGGQAKDAAPRRYVVTLEYL